MAKRSSSIPKFQKPKRKGAHIKGGIGRFLLKLIIYTFLFTLLWVAVYRFVPPPITATMVGDLIDERGVTKDWMSLGEMDRDMVAAAIGAEDGKFCQHGGFDWEAMKKAAERNASGGRIRGGSTISQQTAKNVFLWQGGGYVRKGMEAYFTFLIEHMWGKRRIMEVYLNVAETGIGTYGANAGAMRYFGHDASSLSPSEAARIAAVLPLPKSRAAISPRGFTARYGQTINARINQVKRDGLDACVYDEEAAPDRAGAPAPAQRSVKKAAPEPSAPTLAEPEPLLPDPAETPAETPAEPEPKRFPEDSPANGAPAPEPITEPAA